MAWSYSALTSYETCPYRFYSTRVSKDVVEPAGLPILLGNEAHKALEVSVRDGAPMPSTVEATTTTGETGFVSTSGWEKIVGMVLNTPGEKLVEQQIALDKKLCRVGWIDKDVWVRGIIDLLIINGDKALALDWKTGKRKVDSDQLQLFAALIMHVYPQIDRVDTGFVWLKTKELDRQTFHRNDLPSIWANFNPRVKRLECAYAANDWTKRPSGLCKNWCPVKTCVFCGK